MAILEVRPGLRLLTLAGELDLGDVESLVSQFKQLEHARVTIVDLSKTTYMDSTILGLLVHLHHQKRKRDELVFFVQPNADLLKIFSIAGLDRVISLFGSLEDATRIAIKELTPA